MDILSGMYALICLMIAVSMSALLFLAGLCFIYLLAGDSIERRTWKALTAALAIAAVSVFTYGALWGVPL